MPGAVAVRGGEPLSNIGGSVLGWLWRRDWWAGGGNSRNRAFCRHNSGGRVRASVSYHLQLANGYLRNEAASFASASAYASCYGDYSGYDAWFPWAYHDDKLWWGY